MKIINNDIKELESHIIQCCTTGGIYEERDKEEEIANIYLNKKYNTKDDIIYINKYIDYLNTLNSNDILELLKFSKNLFISKFGERYGNIAFSNFAGNLMEDGEIYSNIINKSITINEFLLKEFNNVYKYYIKNHKYEIGKFISMCMRNLGIKMNVNKNIDMYDYWENYQQEN